jgi:hypothetical protein
MAVAAFVRGGCYQMVVRRSKRLISNRRANAGLSAFAVGLLFDDLVCAGFGCLKLAAVLPMYSTYHAHVHVLA